MPEIVVRTGASGDIIDIHRYSLDQFGYTVAEEYLAGIDDAISSRGILPELGAVQHGISSPIRALTYRSYKIFYNFDGLTVVVVRILHHAMNAAARLGATSPTQPPCVAPG